MINTLPKSLIEAARITLTESLGHPMIDVDGELKHRYNSEGKLIHPHDEGIHNFHKWFGDSKAVDDKGRPQVLYHGTTSDIPAFDKEHIGKNFGLDSHGFFFTSSPHKAARYADTNSQWALATGKVDAPPKEGSNITPVHVSIKNPLTLQHYTWMYDTNPKVEIDDQGISITDYFDDNRHSIIHHAKQDNHDGILFHHNGDHLVIPFEPHQIKSAIGNTGEFHPNKTNITESTSNRPFTQDEHGKNIVFDNNEYKISVNNPDDATFIALWHGGKKVGAMYLGYGRTSDTTGYSSVRSVDIDRKHQGQGMGKQMYRVALQYVHAKYKGIGSEHSDRINKRQVPTILKRLGGKEHESGDITIDR